MGSDNVKRKPNIRGDLLSYLSLHGKVIDSKIALLFIEMEQSLVKGRKM